MSREGESGHRWSVPGMPHRGWAAVYVEDLGEATHTCEACGYDRVRYVHTLAHEQHPTRLRVGCVCAEHLTNDYVNPRVRERRLKNIMARRANWLGKWWRISARGNPWLKHQGRVLVVFRNSRGKGWCASIGGELLDGTFATEAAAKLAIFDAINGVGRRKGGGGRAAPHALGVQLQES